MRLNPVGAFDGAGGKIDLSHGQTDELDDLTVDVIAQDRTLHIVDEALLRCRCRRTVRSPSAITDLRLARITPDHHRPPQSTRV